MDNCMDCGHSVDGHDLRAADGCRGCDACIAARRARATLAAAIRFADTTVRYGTDAARRAGAAEALERHLTEWTRLYGPIVGPVETLWRS